MHSPGKRTEVGMVENVHVTRIKRAFCKPATKSDSNTTPKKESYNFMTEITRDGDDMLNLKPLQFYKYQQYRCVNSLKSCGAPIPSRWNCFFLCFFFVCVLQHVRWRQWISVRFMKSYLLSKFLDNRLLLKTKSSPHTEKVTHVFWWHRELCANYHGKIINSLSNSVTVWMTKLFGQLNFF